MPGTVRDVKAAMAVSSAATVLQLYGYATLAEQVTTAAERIAQGQAAESGARAASSGEWQGNYEQHR